MDTESADGCEFPSTAHLVGSAEFFDDLLRVERPDEPRDADGRQLIRFQAVPFQKRIEKKNIHQPLRHQLQLVKAHPTARPRYPESR